MAHRIIGWGIHGWTVWRRCQLLVEIIVVVVLMNLMISVDHRRSAIIVNC